MENLAKPGLLIDIVDTLRIVVTAVIAGGGGYLIYLLHKSLSPSKRTPGKNKKTAYTVNKRQS